MAWRMLSIVEVVFHTKTVRDNDLQVIERILRAAENVDNLLIHPKKLSFYIWSKGKADYKVLDRLKNSLGSLGYPHFEIVAKEYILSGIGYRYPSSI